MMSKTIFEQMGGTYTRQGDYELPDLTLPTEREFEIGVWGQRYKRHLKANHRVRYYNLLTSGRLNEYLSGMDKRANELFIQLVGEMAKREKVDENLKATDSFSWIRKTNNIRNRATEIVNAEVIFV